MRRKFIKYLLVLLFIILALFAAFAVWTWYQMHVTQSLHVGAVQPGLALGGLMIPQTAVLYGVLAGFFLLLTIVSIWFTYRLVMFPPQDEENKD
jgi:hypothetical protein